MVTTNKGFIFLGSPTKAALSPIFYLFFHSNLLPKISDSILLRIPSYFVTLFIIFPYLQIILYFGPQLWLFLSWPAAPKSSVNSIGVIGGKIVGCPCYIHGWLDVAVGMESGMDTVSLCRQQDTLTHYKHSNKCIWEDTWLVILSIQQQRKLVAQRMQS